MVFGMVMKAKHAEDLLANITAGDGANCRFIIGAGVLAESPRGGKQLAERRQWYQP